MSDTDEVSTTDKVRLELAGARDFLHKQIGFNMLTPAVRYVIAAVETLLEGHLTLLAAHRELQEEFRTYRRKAGPALSAARMHIPIGGPGSRALLRKTVRKK